MSGSGKPSVNVPIIAANTAAFRKTQSHSSSITSNTSSLASMAESDDNDNLALACYHCNAHKGPNLSALDPESGALVRLFNPRLDSSRLKLTVSRGATSQIVRTVWPASENRSDGGSSPT